MACLQSKVGASPDLPAVDVPGAEESVAPASTDEAVGADEEPALDLGAALGPVLLKTYWKQAAGLLVALLVLRWLVRSTRSG